VKGTVALAFLATSMSAADAGFLGSLTQGPSPAAGETGIRMAAEDVFIRLEDSSTALVRAAFLFQADSAESVLMCYPVEVLSPFHSLYDAASPGDPSGSAPGSEVGVLLDGSPARTFLLVQCRHWDDDVAGEAGLIDRYGWDGPSLGDSGCFLIERPPMSDSSAAWAAIGRAEAILVCWEVTFDSGGSRLVEIEDSIRPTSDYSMRLNRITYPLVTGRSWNGTIGAGRISVTGTPGFRWHSLAWAAGVLLPPPSDVDRFVPSPVPGLEGSTLLAPMLGTDLGRAIVWEFKDFEPETGSRDLFTYFPDIGDFGLLADGGESGGMCERSLWESSFVYLFLGPQQPHVFYSIRSGGLGIFDSPGGTMLAEVPPGTYMRVLDRSGDWARICYTTGDGEEAEGWFEMHPVGGSGLVEPSAMPAPESEWIP
jgi:hypothetical protein